MKTVSTSQSGQRSINHSAPESNSQRVPRAADLSRLAADSLDGGDLRLELPLRESRSVTASAPMRLATYDTPLVTAATLQSQRFFVEDLGYPCRQKLTSLSFWGTFAPRSLVSRMAENLTRVESKLMVEAFLKKYQIDLTDAAIPEGGYRSVEELFTRRLKESSRPITSRFVQPSDGEVMSSGLLADDQSIVVKNHGYSAEELVFGFAKATSPYALDQAKAPLASYSLTYLSPQDYHRVHAPVSGTIVSLRYIPGDHWPVNAAFVDLLPDLFVRNERLVIEINLAEGGTVFVVMVAALNVGNLETCGVLGEAFNPLLSGKTVRHINLPGGISCQAGDEMGVFKFGSTVVTLLDGVAEGSISLVDANPSVGKTRMGQPLGINQ